MFLRLGWSSAVATALVTTTILPTACLSPCAATAAMTTTGGAAMDGYGDIRTFGGLSLDTSHAPDWSAWDIARGLAIVSDGSGGWTLDGYGGIHAWGSAPPVDANAYSPDQRARAGPYWPGWDIARALVVLPDKVSGYVLD